MLDAEPKLNPCMLYMRYQYIEEHDEPSALDLVELD